MCAVLIGTGLGEWRKKTTKSGRNGTGEKAGGGDRDGEGRGLREKGRKEDRSVERRRAFNWGN